MTRSDIGRATPRMKWVVLFVAAAAAAYGVALRPFSPGPAWPEDYEAARAAASASGRPLLIQFSSPGCPYCVRMEREVLPDPQVAQSLAAFELVQIDAWQRPHLSERYRVDGIPAFVVVDPRGRFIGKVEGYQPPAAFSDFLRRATKAASKLGSP